MKCAIAMPLGMGGELRAKRGVVGVMCAQQARMGSVEGWLDAAKRGSPENGEIPSSYPSVLGPSRESGDLGGPNWNKLAFLPYLSYNRFRP